METRDDGFVINTTVLYDYYTVNYSVRYSMVASPGQTIEFYPPTIDYAEEEHRVA